MQPITGPSALIHNSTVVSRLAMTVAISGEEWRNHGCLGCASSCHVVIKERLKFILARLFV
mgnify:CR=1 FL=1